MTLAMKASRWASAMAAQRRSRRNRTARIGKDAHLSLTGSALGGSADEVLVPPDALIDLVGGGGVDGYLAAGSEFFEYFVTLGQLKSDGSVLDVGCGSGRMAVPLTKYLTTEGHYQGFDIVPPAIEWCTNTITARYPQFYFSVADVLNNIYNPVGKHTPAEYTFPYPSESFDLVYLTSVFTHMLPDDMERYLSEIIRTLKPGGRCLITFFLSNDESRSLTKARRSTLLFDYDGGTYSTVNAKEPEHAICFEEEYIRKTFSDRGLRIAGPIHFGSWCGREDFLSYQDIIVAVKE